MRQGAWTKPLKWRELDCSFRGRGIFIAPEICVNRLDSSPLPMKRYGLLPAEKAFHPELGTDTAEP